MFIAKKTETGFKVADHTAFLPNTSFSVGGPTTAQIVELGFIPVTTWKPHDRKTQALVPVAPYAVDGQVFTVKVAPLSAEDILQKTEDRAAEVRSERDRKLAATDWRIIKVLEGGQPQDFAWAAYRQALRDITSQTGFPWEVQWPTQPE